MLIYPGAFKDVAGNPNTAIMGRTKDNFVSGDCLGASSDEFDNAGKLFVSVTMVLYTCLLHAKMQAVFKYHTELGEPRSIEDCEGTAVVRLTETADTTPPLLLTEVIDYGLGTLTLTFSETIDVKPPESLCSPTNVVGGTQLAWHRRHW